MNENRINIAIKGTLRSKQPQSIKPVTIGSYTYSPCDSIGLGYISNVYRGRNRITNQPVAIKVIDTSNQDALVEQFLDSEIQLLQKIKLFGYKRLLKLCQSFKIDKKVYIVTQLCQGKDLAKALREKKTFSDRQAQTIMKKILKAYAQCYALGVVHRDLKLSNILVKDGQLILADFGFAVTILNCLQQFPYNAGSPYYMSPEALKRNRFSFKSDVWALGVMAYELVFGKLPFKEKVESLQYDKVMEVSVQQLMEGSNISEQYKNFIIACMDTNMQSRAQPQFAISYYWPLAQRQLPQYFRQFNSSHNLPQPLSAGLPIKKHNPIHLPFKTSQTPQHHSNHSVRFNKIENNSEYGSLWSTQLSSERSIKAEQRISIEEGGMKRKVALTQPPMFRNVAMIRPPVKSITQYQLNPASMVDNRPSLMNGHQFPQQLSKTQALVSCYLQYCNFMINLYHLLQQQAILPQGQMLKQQIASQIIIIFTELTKYLKGENSGKFGLMPNYPKYGQTIQYIQLRDKVIMEGQSFANRVYWQGQNIQYGGILQKYIQYLIGKVSVHYYLLQQFCQLQQMKNEESKGVQWFIRSGQVEQFYRVINYRKNNYGQAQCNNLQRWARELTQLPP